MDAPQAPQKPECTWLITSRRQLYWPAFDLLHVELLPPEAPIAACTLCHFARLSEVNENLFRAPTLLCERPIGRSSIQSPAFLQAPTLPPLELWD